MRKFNVEIQETHLVYVEMYADNKQDLINKIKKHTHYRNDCITYRDECEGDDKILKIEEVSDVQE